MAKREVEVVLVAVVHAYNSCGGSHGICRRRCLTAAVAACMHVIVVVIKRVRARMKVVGIVSCGGGSRLAMHL